ncbi:MAG: hypothetical protein QOG94_2520 [Solirubrobacteraceae bacterium]|nr:hypothetical protein [Solirubrobacteraceae bacterium]
MDPTRPLATLLAIAAVAALAPAAGARPREEGVTRLEQAREESAVRDRPRSVHELPAGLLRVSPSELLATGGQEVELSVTLDRAVADGTLELTLPERWVGRSGVSDLLYARVPATGRAAGAGARASRSGRSVRFAFAGAAAGASASLKVSDVGIPAGDYELPYRWREAGRARSSPGTARVIFYAPVREPAEGEGEAEPEPDWLALTRDVNATNDTGEESETFVSVVPGNRLRYLVGANTATGFNAWITNTGDAPFAKAAVSATFDAPDEGASEPGRLCCDPTAAADAAGNLWYGGLSFDNGDGSPSRAIVARAAPGATTFGALTTGLRTRTGGDQDKPMMTIDNSPTSPAYGRLYVIWDEIVAGVNIVMTQCDTRPGGVLNAARCDNADNWTTPVSVTPAQGGYIYADVATGPDGKVYVVWWDYSALNAIRGDVCDPAGQNCASAGGWGTPQTIATLDDTGSEPLPFACPIVAQPGGRASTSPQVDVDRSPGPNRGRVYVTWSDLRTASGATRCGIDPNSESGDGMPPLPTHLTWDSFVASAAGALPGGPGRSPTVATPLLTDGEGGGQANSDDWFSWLAVDQGTGQAWADFYSTRDDATRRTTHFYVRAVTPTADGHALGPLHRVSTAPTNYSAFQCCRFGNDYGDYTGIDAAQGVALPVWSDRRPLADGEAYVAPVTTAIVVAAARTIDDSPAAGGNGDGVLEPGESFRLDQSLRNVGSIAATGVSATLSAPAGSGVTPTAGSAYPDIASAATQGNATPLTARMAAGAPCGAALPLSLLVRIAGEPAVVPLAPIQTACPPPPAPPPPPVAPPVAPPPPEPPAPVAPPPPAPRDTTIVFALAASSPQKPPTARRGIVVTLSCPYESCRVAIKGTLTIPASTRGGAAKRYKLPGSTVSVPKASRKKHTLRVSSTLRRRIARALRSARSRSGVKVLVTATARDVAGNRSTKKKTIRVRR